MRVARRGMAAVALSGTTAPALFGALALGGVAVFAWRGVAALALGGVAVFAWRGVAALALGGVAVFAWRGGVRLAWRCTATTVCCAAIAVFVATGTLAGCGGVLSPDLFIVYRTGSYPGAKLTMLVNEEGGVQCNPSSNHSVAPHRLSDPQLIEARTIQEDLHIPASKHLSLPPGPGSVLTYYARDQDGSVRFADNSQGQPTVTQKLAAFVLNVAQEVCRLPQQGA